ncbi:hypothetical protein XI06_10495 [Bradyrhizobium sp. CCBAU 11434]|uniref:outer membrane protein n=1 Tax=Bradyrhizobium sp. CCBAU 11434 TaxID=1630885 RepID=UPI002305184F|nr:outer membrane beta-barrel protein [Bradyrhizobium sp. CCBAU 11434]MDA9520786.1 hypothetical protein [Bradyrhizobium sp. CCBAU 11434]
MKAALKSAIASSMIIASVGSTYAADMAVKAPPLPPPVVASWTGCYIGGDVGWYHAHQNGDTSAFPSPGFGAPAINGAGIAGYGVLPTSHGLSRDSVLGGGYGGCNWQQNKWVFGFEGDITWTDNKTGSDAQTVVGSFTGQPANFPPLGTNMQLNSSTQWLASLRGRVGMVVGAGDNVLLYGTGGVAFTDTKYSAVFTPSTNPASLFGFGCPGAAATTCFGTSAVAFSRNQVGWVAGAGVEWRVAPQWLVRVEYLHYGFDGASGIVPAVLANGAAACAGCGWRANWGNLDIDSVRVGAAYQFGGPVVAKY